MSLSLSEVQRVEAVHLPHKEGESPQDRELRLDAKRATLSKQLERERTARIVQRYAIASEWGTLVTRLKALSLTDRAFLPWFREQAWLFTSHQDLRRVALRMVDRRIDRLKAAAGLERLDDPVPPASSVYFEVKRLLAVR